MYALQRNKEMLLTSSTLFEKKTEKQCKIPSCLKYDRIHFFQHHLAHTKSQRLLTWKIALFRHSAIPLKYGRVLPWQRKFNLKRFTCTIIHNKRLRVN